MPLLTTLHTLSKLPVAQLVSENRPAASHWPGPFWKSAKTKSCAKSRWRVTIAIDDFGAGYSSFSSLRALPFAELKVDSSFVKNGATDANNAAICQTAVDLAHRFGSMAVGRRREHGRPAGRAADAARAFPRIASPARQPASMPGEMAAAG
jgi:EAL domain